jgi:glycosyltransferase involved in cell wall biosynthesis
MEFSVPAVIPVFIGARVTKTAVRSAIQQPEVTEVMIINNGSTDATQSILEQLEQDDEPLAYSRLVSFMQAQIAYYRDLHENTHLTGSRSEWLPRFFVRDRA